MLLYVQFQKYSDNLFMNIKNFIKFKSLFPKTENQCLFCKNVKLPREDENDITPKSEVKVCKIPFEWMEFQPEGNVNPCSLGFLKSEKPAGNIMKQDVCDVWNGDVYKELRQKVLKGDYSLCKTDNCYIYDYCSPDEIPSDYEKGPKVLMLCYDCECNYKCITCRDAIKLNTPEQTELYDNVYLPQIIKIAENVNFVTLSCVGEPLFSKHSKRLMSELVKKYPHIRFMLSTNGFYMDEKTLTETGILDNIYGVSVSINAAKSDTYKKIFRVDGFDRVINNVEMMYNLKQQGKIEFINLNFVVHSINYKEMTAFAELARHFDAKAIFTAYKPWTSAELHKNYDEVAVFEPSHKNYKDFVEIMQNPVFKDEEYCKLGPILHELVYS